MPSRSSNRREFLQGKVAAELITDRAVSEEADTPVCPGERAPIPAPAKEGYLLKLTRQAMACEFQVFLNPGQYEEGIERVVEGLDLIEQLEDQLTVYRDHSEVSRINQRAGETPVIVEPRLFALLQQAVALHSDTAGAYDITAGPLTKAWGFYRRAGRIPEPDELAEAMSSMGSQHLLLDSETKTVRFGKAGLEINLGSIGKGYALDCCAEWLTTGGVRDFLLHGGNSSVLGHGSHGVSTNDASVDSANRGWSIGLPHPLRPGERVGEFTLRDGALGTSGTVAQFFLFQGKRYGHILDPRTGYPAEGVLSATVLAPSAALADALSTAFFVGGPSVADAYCRQHPAVGMPLILPGQKAGSINLQTMNLTPEVVRWN